jgi:hypothetical protein
MTINHSLKQVVQGCEDKSADGVMAGIIKSYEEHSMA